MKSRVLQRTESASTMYSSLLFKSTEKRNACDKMKGSMYSVFNLTHVFVAFVPFYQQRLLDFIPVGLLLSTILSSNSSYSQVTNSFLSQGLQSLLLCHDNINSLNLCDVFKHQNNAHCLRQYNYFF